MVTFLSGGTGTPKLLWGAEQLYPRSETTVIANTGDDVALGGLHVSPDIDTLLFEGAGILDQERWWGITGDTTETHSQVAALAKKVDLDEQRAYLAPEKQTSGHRLSRWRRFATVPEFMTIGDRDRAHHMVRTQLLRSGQSLTAVTATLADAYSLEMRVLPMSDDPIATIVHTPDGPVHFQEYWVRDGGKPAVTAVEFRGSDSANPTTAVKEALKEPVIIGPANPVTSIGPMTALEAFADLLTETPVVAVSPFVEDNVFSGPAGELLAGIGYEPSTGGMATLFDFVDAYVLDTEDDTELGAHIVRTETEMTTQSDAKRVARACQTAIEEVA